MKKILVFVLCPVVSFFVHQAYGQSNPISPLPDWAFGPFIRPPNLNPILSPNPSTRFLDPMTGKTIDWESNDTFNPGATVYKGKVVLLYRAEDRSGVGIGFRTSRLGFASSRDGLRFQTYKFPVLYPDRDAQKNQEWPGGCEDPRLAMTERGVYYVYYTQWNRKIPRIGVAKSNDLRHWRKYGPIFSKALHGRFADTATKSASIVTQLKKGRQVIAKINGKFWMYWGEHHVYAATSTNLVDWTPVTNPAGELVQLASPRKGFFDSELTECGPPALITSHGILLVYNGKNKAGADGDPRTTPNTYAAGQFLFDRQNPQKMIARLDSPFMRPTAPYEKNGQYRDGTVFMEGMVHFHDRWYLYYGCADSRVAVAVYDPKKRLTQKPRPLVGEK